MWSTQYYNAADIDTQATALWDGASFVGYYPNEEGKTVGLYSLDTFYVELVFDNFHNEIKRLTAITVDDAVDKYLTQLQVE